MATRTILVADDSQTVHRIVEMACNGQDVEVLAVADGDQAVAHIVERRPEVVLADIGMPGRNGYEVAAFVRAQPDLSQTPVVLLAGMFDVVDEARARALGCVEVLVKPLKPQYISQRLPDWFSAAPPVVVSAPDAASIDAYFNRLDQAFQTLGPPAATAVVSSAEAPGSAAVPHVPTLRELLSRLPEETRTRLTPPAASAQPAAGEDSLLDEVAERVLRRLATRDDLLEELARHVARRRLAGDDR